MLKSGKLKYYAKFLEHGLRFARAYAALPKHAPLYKVPPLLRYANRSDYEPTFFTFSLFNDVHSPCTIAPCDSYKIKIAQALTSEDSFEKLLLFLVDRVGDIRKLYSFEQIPYHDDDDATLQPRDLALILALDALTVVAAACYQECIRPITMCMVIWRDAFLMEQQLPLFVLQAALDSITFDAGPRASEDDTVVSFDAHHGPEFGNSRFQIDDVVSFYALHTSYPFMRNVQTLRKRQHSPINAMEQSLLSRIHTMFIDDGSKREHHVVSSQMRSMPTASRLQKYGIKFAVGDGGFTGIYFDKKSKVLTLPEITVFSTTKSYLLNLVAQEVAVSWYDDQPCPVSSFILLMGFLIDAEKDVRVLVDAQVVCNHLGSHAELAAMWKSLGVNLPISLTNEDSRVIDTVREATACEARRLESMPQHTKPWLLINSVLVVFLLLALTCVQTTYSALRFYSRGQ